MSSEVLLRAHDIGKVYTGTEHPLTTLRNALFGTSIQKADHYPVLAGIDLTIHRGETVGIMGRNGAGKTTLLGILGNVIQPTTGRVERSGRISTLLGLTAGFNPNFTGRENAFLFCSIQGLTHEEAQAKIGKIQAFADLGRYFDLPIRTYSSGMQARLSFSCAIHVDSDLIIIDETLAVGDANFRMKCYDRIRHMRDTGQTFLMVSHNQNLVANFCTRGVVLEGGGKVFDGPTFDAVEVYKRIRTEAMGDDDFEGKLVKGTNWPSKLHNDVTLEGMAFTSQPGDGMATLHGVLKAHKDVDNITLNFGISNHLGIVVCAIDGVKAGLIIPYLQSGESQSMDLCFSRRRLLPGRYYVSAIVHTLVGDVTKPLALYQNFLSFEVGGDSSMAGMADLSMAIAIGKD